MWYSRSSMDKKQMSELATLFSDALGIDCKLTVRIDKQWKALVFEGRSPSTDIKWGFSEVVPLEQLEGLKDVAGFIQHRAKRVRRGIDRIKERAGPMQSLN